LINLGITAMHFDDFSTEEGICLVEDIFETT